MKTAFKLLVLAIVLVPLLGWGIGIIPGVPSPQRALLMAQSANTGRDRDESSSQARVVLAWIDGDYHGNFTRKLGSELGLPNAELVFDPTIIPHNHYDSLWRLNTCRHAMRLLQKWHADVVISGKRSKTGTLLYVSSRECAQTPRFDRHRYALETNHEVPARYDSGVRFYVAAAVLAALPPPPPTSSQFPILLRTLKNAHKALGEAAINLAPDQPEFWRLSLRDAQAKMLVRLGYLQEDLRPYQAALAIYTAALDKVRNTTSTPTLDRMLSIMRNNHGAVIGLLLQFDERGKPQPSLAQKAADAFQLALPAQNQARYPTLWSTTMANIGYMQLYIAVLTRDTSLLGDAANTFRSTLAIQNRVAPKPEQARAKMGLAETLARIGAWTQRHKFQADALATYEEVLALAPKELSPFRWSKSQQDIGLITARIGKARNDPQQLQKAVDLFRQVLATDVFGRTPSQRVTAQLNLASTIVLLANKSAGEQRDELLAEASQILTAAEDMLRDNPDPRLELNIRATRSLLRKISLR